ncbi:MAG TPA: macro domain-containing protein [Thermosulfidibacter takaii]|uniref:Macro domain-containing protein n=1 Tax=Thermosulfidibacter takaii TaxID=412593 RepID=A0A7C0Y6E5_9BACT|nr:macro domain-containing protein [Thermosulfidibacter takaii]
MERKLGKVVVKLEEGDITELATDAIVNAANNHFWMGAGVAGAIKKKGGEEIEKEAVAKGPQPVGEAIVTGAGKLKARYVIHAAVMGQDLKTDAEKIQAATYNALLRAHELGLKSIAFPALGTGVGGFSLKEAAKIMFQATEKFLQDHPDTSLEEVVFCLFGDQAYNAFAGVMSAWRS